MSNGQLLVLGDCSIDEYLVLDPHFQGPPAGVSSRPGYRMLRVPGGAWLLRAVVEEVVAEVELPVRVRGVERPGPAEEGQFRHSLAFLGRFRPSSTHDALPTYRLSTRPRFREAALPPPAVRLSPAEPGLPTIALLEHKSLTRAHSAISMRIGLGEVRPQVIIHKLSSYVDNSLTLQGDLDFGQLLTVVVLDADTLRYTGYRVSRALSWERTAHTAVQALTAANALSDARGATLIVIRLGHAGFLHRFRCSQGDDWTDRLLFDPSTIEGEWGDSSSAGAMFGYLSTVTAQISVALARQLLSTKGLESALADGMADEVECALQLARNDNMAAFVNGIGFDLDALEAFEDRGGVPNRSAPEGPKAHSLVPALVPDSETWDLATQAFPSEASESAQQALGAATEIVTSGLDPKSGVRPLPEIVPYASVSRLFAIGRNQLETLRSAKLALDQYLAGSDEKPLSLAVFGQPGAGKSFAVRQLAQSTDASTLTIETNLSQLAGPSDLEPVFQRARDISVSGQIPIVFFDEFDSDLGGDSFGWLRHFLAPMQDGLFHSGRGPYRLGRSVLVFAGGTSHSYAEFLAPLVEGKVDRATKYPDFVSRLHGYLDMAGVGQNVQDDDRILDLLRRSILLRSMIERDSRELVDLYTGKARLDERYVAVLLTVPLQHGARSLESIVRLSRPDDRGRLMLSSLPPSDSLAAHVQPRKLEEAIASAHR